MNMATETYDDISTRNRSMDDYDEPFEHRYFIFLPWYAYLILIACPIAIFGGVFAHILAFVVLVRSRLWLKHEGYVYLAANLCANVGVLLFCTSSFWYTSVYGSGYYYPPNTSAFMCKVWHFLMSIFFASGWLSVALLFNIYLREHLIHRRRCGCPMFAAKYCTLFASKIIVGVIFSVLFICGIPYLANYELHHGGRCYATQHMDLGLLVESILMWVLPFFLFLPIILLMTLCTKREGNTFGFSQIEERSVSQDQMRAMAVTLSSMTLFSQFLVVFLHFNIVHRPSFAEGAMLTAELILSLSVGFIPGLYVHGGNVGASVVIELVFALSLGLQPILCFVILKALRDGFRSQLRNILCCRRLFPSLNRDEEVVRLSAIQEDPPSTAET